jgi:GntR family transcriptional regulator
MTEVEVESMATGADTVDRDDPVPYYQQVKRLVARRIQRDHMSTGDLLPSEAELCEIYGVSRTVVRQAIGDLVNEGLLQRMRGKGTFVAGVKLREQFMESTVGFFEDMTARGHRVTSKIMSADFFEADDKVAEALDIDPGSTCIELVRLRSVNGEVVAFTKSYIRSDSEALLADLRGRDIPGGSLYRLLEDRWHMRINSGHRSLEIAKADRKLAGLLEIRTGDPVMAIESVGRDSMGKPIEYFNAWHRGDRVRFEMDVVRSRRDGIASA